MIKVVNLIKKYNHILALDDISYSFEKGNIYSIIGSSGSGKSTFIKCIASLEQPDQGKICYQGIDKQNIGFIFQNFNLFNNMTVLENIIYAPQKVLNLNKEEAVYSAQNLLKAVNLNSSIEDQYPHSLSGGQKQRVSIARAIAMNPKVILYDEPTSALDPENIIEILNIIKNLSLSKDLLSIIVTHHIKFAQIISDKILFFENGKILVEGDSSILYGKMKNKRLREFLSKFHIIDT